MVDVFSRTSYSRSTIPIVLFIFALYLSFWHCLGRLFSYINAMDFVIIH
jgi:hypothetical protein